MLFLKLNKLILFVQCLLFNGLEINMNPHEQKRFSLNNWKNALVPRKLFPRMLKAKEISNIEEYVPIDSRHSYTGEYKVWPSTFDSFLLNMKLPILPSLKYILHNSKTSSNGEILDPWNPKTLLKSSWIPNVEVKVLIHGYRQNSKSQNMPVQLLRAYRNMNSSANIVIVDWSKLAYEEYLESAMYAVKVGRALGEVFIVFKNNQFITDFYDIHIIGFCLGAHIAGIASLHLKKRIGDYATVGRITGLDPAGIGFNEARDELRLNSGDADFVDIIHTSAGSGFLAGDLGIQPRLGDADFYPNGGKFQPICKSSRSKRADMISACSHLKAPDYYKRSIDEEIFRSCPCNTWSAFDSEQCQCESGPLMGERVSKTIGKYYLYVFEYTLFEMFEDEDL